MPQGQTEQVEVRATLDLPKYRCHKEVFALKIRVVGPQSQFDDGLRLTPEDTAYAPFWVSGVYVRKHAPQAGGYYVRYADGYESWSPAAVFEAGYTRI